tara:strand:- start:1761 stop:1910 length:150 start_codon:yes stop_codon:yes gene_type:complete
MTIYMWSRGADKTPTFELIYEELRNIKIAVEKLSNISMYDDKKLLKIKL